MGTRRKGDHSNRLSGSRLTLRLVSPMLGDPYLVETRRVVGERTPAALRLDMPLQRVYPGDHP